MNLRLLFSGLFLAAATLLTAQNVTITFNVGTEFITVNDGGLYVAGGATFGAPGNPDNQLTDPDGDGVYSLTITRPAGFSDFYTLANGNCPDYGCKENIGGQDCANPSNFNDRFLPAVTSDVVINTCFGECSTTTTCSPPPASTMVTFSLDMNDYTEAFTAPYVSGGFNSWAGDANPMSDDDGDGVWTATIEIPAGPNEFKFQLDQWTVQEMFTGEETCTTAPGEFVNRIFTPEGGDQTLPTYCFNSCTNCGATETSIVTFSLNMNDYTEAFTTAYVSGGFNSWFGDANPMTDDDGDGIWTAQIEVPAGPNEFKFQLDQWTVQEMFTGDEDCTTAPGEFVNRIFTPDADEVSLPTFCFNSCTDCTVNTIDLAAYGIDFNLYPTVVDQELNFTLGQSTAQRSTVQIVTAEGKLVQTMEIQGEQRQQLDVSQLPAGFYFVRLQHRDAVGVRRFVKQ